MNSRNELVVKSGDVLAKDIYKPGTYQLLMSQGSIITDEDILKIRKCGVHEIEVLKESSRKLGNIKEKLENLILDNKEIESFFDSNKQSEIVDIIRSAQDENKNLFFEYEQLFESHSQDLPNHVNGAMFWTAVFAPYFEEFKCFRNLTNLVASAYIHDIGKIKIDKAILEAPRNLTSEEFKIITMHPIYGYDMLMKIEEPYHAIIAGSHHLPKYGKNGLKPTLESKFITAIDIFTALTENRFYRQIQRKSEDENKNLKYRYSIPEALFIMYDMCKDGSIDRNIFTAINFRLNEYSSGIIQIDFGSNEYKN